MNMIKTLKRNDQNINKNKKRDFNYKNIVLGEHFTWVKRQLKMREL